MTFITENDKRAIRKKLEEKYERANSIIEKSRIRYSEYNVDYSDKYTETVFLVIVFIIMLICMPFAVKTFCKNFDSRLFQVSGLTAYISIGVHIFSIAVNNISNIGKSEVLFRFIEKVNKVKGEIREKMDNIDAVSREFQKEISNQQLIKPMKDDTIDKEIDRLTSEMLSLDFGGDFCERFRDVMYYLSAIIVNFAATVIVGSFVADSLYEVIGIHNAVTILIFGIVTFVTMFVLGAVKNRIARYLLMLISFIAPALIGVIISLSVLISMAIPFFIIACMVIAGLVAVAIFIFN